MPMLLSLRVNGETREVAVPVHKTLLEVLREYAAYYNEARTHLSLERNAPTPRAREPADGRLVPTRVLGGLHHRYRKAA